jgi:sulfur dioxygenase
MLVFRQLFDYDTWTYTYLLGDSVSGEAVLIDTVRERVERDLMLLKELGLQLKFVFDTHVHADHITGAAKLRDRTGAKIAVARSAGVSCSDISLDDNQELTFGPYKIKAISTPGHTDTCMTFFSEGMLFTGDTLFVRDVGRTDFQQGSNEKMFHSIKAKIFSYPDNTVIYPGHDYKGHLKSTVGEEKMFNEKLGRDASFSLFSQRMVEMNLGPPKRLAVSVPANLLCGQDPSMKGASK